MNKIINTENGTNNNENEDINDNSDDEIWDYLKQYDTNGETITPWSHEASELDSFLREKNLAVKDNPLKWWQQRKSIYLNLFQLAKKYWSIPASVTCERFFSKPGQISTERRNKLTSKKLKEILFMRPQ